MYQKTEIKGIYRSTESNALVNRDNDALMAYKRKKQASQEIDRLKHSYEELDGRINNLENQNKEIIGMLKQLLQNNKV